MGRNNPNEKNRKVGMAMSLPRPRSILDATPLRGAFATNVVSTGAPKRAAEDAAPSSGGGDCDITECSDAEFNKWLEKRGLGVNVFNDETGGAFSKSGLSFSYAHKVVFTDYDVFFGL